MINDKMGNTTRLNANTGKTVIKRAQNKHLDARIAAQKLSVPMEWLIKVIPCTEKRHERDASGKIIEKHLWSIELISKLCHIKKNPYTVSDVKYVAVNCCKGDLKWANEIIDELKSPLKYATLYDTSGANLLKTAISNNMTKHNFHKKNQS